MIVLLPFKELAAPNARIFVSILVHLNSVVSAEERHNEFAVLFVLVLRDKSSLKSEDILVVCKDLCHVLFGWFRLQAKHATEGVLRSAIAVERRNLMFDGPALKLFVLGEREFNAKLVPEVSFGKVISIIDIAFSAEDVDRLSSCEVLRFVVFFFLETHAGINGIDGLFGKFLARKEQRERISS